MSAPIPFEAPVTTATFPFSFPFFIVFLSSFIFVFILFFSIDLDFLCVGCFEFIPLTDNARSDRGVRRWAEILRFPLLHECVFRLETFDDVGNTAPSHKFSDGRPDSPRLAWHN